MAYLLCSYRMNVYKDRTVTVVAVFSYSHKKSSILFNFMLFNFIPISSLCNKDNCIKFYHIFRFFRNIFLAFVKQNSLQHAIWTPWGSRRNDNQNWLDRSEIERHWERRYYSHELQNFIYRFLFWCIIVNTRVITYCIVKIYIVRA